MGYFVWKPYSCVLIFTRGDLQKTHSQWILESLNLIFQTRSKHQITLEIYFSKIKEGRAPYTVGVF